MSVKSLVSDPDFDKLSPQDKQAALSAVDPDFSKIGVDEVDQVVSSIRGPAALPDNRGMIRKGWDALAIPEQKSREGLKMLAGYVPNPEPKGNLSLDLMKGTPKIAADTLAEFAPSFISRGSIVTGGATKVAGEMAPLAKMALRSIGQQGEDLSGIAPKAAGALESAYKDPTLILSKGKKAAGAMYEAGKAEIQQGANIFKGMYKPEEILDTAKTYLEKGGALEPAEALTARKAVDSLMKSGRYVKDELLAMRDTFDEMAKASSNIAKGDAVYQRGVKAEALRHVFPQNKYGGASAFKLGIMTALENMGGIGKAAMLGISPAVQGVAATAAGVGARQVLGPLAAAPEKAAAITALLQSLARRKSK
jgi:hypothetical protein